MVELSNCKLLKFKLLFLLSIFFTTIIFQGYAREVERNITTVHCKVGMSVEIDPVLTNIINFKLVPGVGSPEFRPIGGSYEITDIKNNYAKLESYKGYGWLKLNEQIDWYQSTTQLSLNSVCKMNNKIIPVSDTKKVNAKSISTEGKALLNEIDLEMKKKPKKPNLVIIPEESLNKAKKSMALNANSTAALHLLDIINSDTSDKIILSEAYYLIGRLLYIQNNYVDALRNFGIRHRDFSSVSKYKAENYYWLGKTLFNIADNENGCLVMEDIIFSKIYQSNKKVLSDSINLQKQNNCGLNTDNIDYEKYEVSNNINDLFDKDSNYKENEITALEIEALKNQLHSCLNLNVGVANLKDIKPVIYIEVNPDRTVKSAKVVNKEKLNDPSFRTAAEAAMRAVNNPDCSPLNLPQGKYHLWKEINFTFNFSWMFDQPKQKIMQKPKTLYVDASNLNVRNSPNGSEILGTLTRNAKVQQIKKTSNWSKVRSFETGLEGWVFNDYLSENLTSDIDNVYVASQSPKDDSEVNNKKSQTKLGGFEYKSFCKLPKNGYVQGYIIKKYCAGAWKSATLEEFLAFKDSGPSIKQQNNTSEQDTSFTTKDIELEVVEKINDVSPPIIQCNNNLFTQEKSIIVNCSIQDDSDLYAILVDKEQITTSKNFSHQIQVPIGKSNILVEAFDEFGNVSDFEVSITREFNLTINDQEVLEKLSPGDIKVRTHNNRIAIVIGIKDYKDIPDTKYGDKDALTFIDYATDSLGIKPKNIQYLIDSEASILDLEELDQWLSKKIKQNTEVFFYYSGHGFNNNGESLLLPFDFRSNLVDRSSISKDEFIQNILSYNPEHIYAFFDACFSGLGREGETLIAGLRNISIAEEEKIDNVTIFNSASGAQFSSDYDEVGHGLFSYYLMKGLEGKADMNEDQQISTSELYSYIEENVSSTALSIGFAQNPSLLSLQDKMILKW